MRLFRKFPKPFSKKDIDLVGAYVAHNSIPYTLIIALVAVLEIVMLIRGIIIFDFSKTHHILYVISYVFLLLVSLIVLFFMGISRRFKDKHKVLYGLSYFYSAALFVWSFLVSYIDMGKGSTPIVYLTIMITVSGIMLINPLIYDLLLIPSALAIFIVNSFRNPNPGSAGEYINVAIFIIMSLIMNIRIFRVTEDDYNEKVKLELITITDSLTNLGNETKYIKDVQRLEELINKGEKHEFIVIMMDVNNLKNTNDLYGHRYGCHLIVEAGHRLPGVFKNSSLYHIGGDEFLCIIEDKNEIENFENSLKDFKEKLEYQLINFDGKELILSLAIGYAKHESNMKYYDVLQKADSNMYQNKKAIKEKYNIKGC